MGSIHRLCLALLLPRLLGCSVSEPDAERVIALPFLVSDEFTPSGYMGDGSGHGVITMHVDDPSCHIRTPDSGGSCFRFDYRPPIAGSVGWGGVYFQAPPNNWGSQPGKRIAPGAKQLRLKAAGVQGGELATFRIGGLSGMDASGAPYPTPIRFNPSKLPAHDRHDRVHRTGPGRRHLRPRFGRFCVDLVSTSRSLGRRALSRRHPLGVSWRA